MITITLNKIKAHDPCEEGWEKLLEHLGKTESDDDEFTLAEVLKSNGLNDALWCLRCLPEHDKKWRLLAVQFARQVQHLMTDERSINALDVAERYANGEATEYELAAAKSAAWDSARADLDAWTHLAAWDAAWAAWSVAWCDAWDAARAAARDVARDVASEKQIELFKEAIA
jgi:hypothetical protein